MRDAPLFWERILGDLGDKKFMSLTKKKKNQKRSKQVREKPKPKIFPQNLLGRHPPLFPFCFLFSPANPQIAQKLKREILKFTNLPLGPKKPQKRSWTWRRNSRALVFALRMMGMSAKIGVGGVDMCGRRNEIALHHKQF
ncbi:MAG: hypothetical protein CM15mP21_5640 [Hyphomicrobiales bacterium]|nr:MAG: hypothetical protein CM15mP21_5640 [Hyphomicrobiales bacterium]